MASLGREGYIIALRDRPDLIIFDTATSDIPAIELLRKLRSDKRTAEAIYIALAAVSDSDQKENMLAAGCSRFFLKTRESIDILLSLLLSPAPLQQTGRLKKERSDGILGVFLSAKGGVGTSSLCANVAQNISTVFPNLDVAVMDLVLPIGSIASIVGHQGEFDIHTATSLAPADLNGDSLRLWLTPLVNWRFRFLAGSPDPETAEALEQDHLMGVTHAFRQICDLTLVDLGRSLSSANLGILKEADVVVLVTNMDVSTLNLTKTLWQFLQSKGMKQQRIYLLVNQGAEINGLGKVEAEQLLGLGIRATIPFMGGSFASANNQHLPLLVRMPNDGAANIIKQVSLEILETARHNRI
jgi:Flp pilus assembly CpaE family ATPase